MMYLGIVSFILSLIFLPIGCMKSGSKSDKPGDKTTETNSPTDKPAPKTEGELTSTTESYLTLQLYLSRDHDAKASLSYVDVSEIFQKRCVSCHGNTPQSPNLSGFPFQSGNNEALASIVAKIDQRIENTSRPMPPQGVLAEDERKPLHDWIAGGYLALPPLPAESVELADYSLDLSWTIDGHQESVHKDGVRSGSFVQELGSLPSSKSIAVEIKVTGPRNVVVFEKKYASLSINPGANLRIPMNARAVDVAAPIPGQRGEIRSSGLTTSAVNLNWTVADDAETAADALKYSLYVSPTDSLDTLENIKAKGTLLKTEAALTGLAVSALNPSTKYHFNVVVSDEFGNEAAYSEIVITTEDEAVVSEYPNCITVASPNRARVTAWRNAVTADLESSGSSTAIGARIRQCFPSAVPSCIQPALDYATRSDIFGADVDGPVANMPQRQPPAVFRAPNGQGQEYFIPPNVEQIAAENNWPYVRYKSRMSGGFDSDTPNLLMVYVPGDRVNPPVSYDRWLNFATPFDPGETRNSETIQPAPQAGIPTLADYLNPAIERTLPRVFTMVSLERASATTTAEVFFQKFRRTGGTATFTPEENSEVPGCATCHPNGLRAISPLGLHVRNGELQLPERDWRAATEINAAMITSAGGKAVSWRSGVVNGVRKPFFNPASQGPIVGPVVPLNDRGTRSRAFIMGEVLPNGQTTPGCYNSQTTIELEDIFRRPPGYGQNRNIYTMSAAPVVNWEKVRDAMSCASCHNNVARGALNDVTSSAEIAFKILVDQSMPLGAHFNPLDVGSPQTPVRDDLTPDERIALVNCLSAEFNLEQRKVAKSLQQVQCQ